jgi:hypothetical protein
MLIRCSVLIVVFTILLAAAVTAQVSVPENASVQTDRSIFGVGLSAGMASGFGLSFRHHLPGSLSYQIVGGIIKADSKTYSNIGGEIQVDFVKGEVTRFYGSVAAGYFYKGSSGNNDLAGPVRGGFGVGGEWLNLNPFHFAGELLFTYFSDGTILPLPQVSAHYYFF